MQCELSKTRSERIANTSHIDNMTYILYAKHVDLSAIQILLCSENEL